MRTRSLLASAAVLGVMTFPGGTAHAEEDVDPPGGGATGSVTLPTGQHLTIDAGGMLAVAPGEETAFAAVKNAGGDRLVVPVDDAGAIAEDRFDLEDFNVDAIGTGRATADASAEPEASADAEEVTITAQWLDGSAPEFVLASLVHLESGRSGTLEFNETGSLSLQLEPGRYHLVSTLHKSTDAGLVAIASIEEFRVRSRAVEVVIDGSEAEPLGFDLDREAAVETVMLDLFSYAPGTQSGAWSSVWAFDGTQLYAIPTDRLSGGRDVGFVLREGFASPSGTTDPYAYNLVRIETDGLPCDLVEAVHDEDLARVDAEYQSLGVDSELHRMDRTAHPLYEQWAWAGTGTVSLPSERTEFYSAGPDFSWKHKGMFAYEKMGSPYDDVTQDGGAMAPGSVATQVWNDGPVTVGLDLPGSDFYWPAVSRVDDPGFLMTHPLLFSSGDADEAIFSEYHPGKTTLSQEGGILYQESWLGMATPLEDLAPGRVELSTAVDREAAWTSLGTRGSADWSFTYDPAGNPVQPVSVVNFDLPGIVNGQVPSGTVQEAALEFATQPGADDQECAAMTFEVSFDDGETWTEVAIDREGDTAAAAIALPDDAAFGSVRFTAADANGNTVAHETIRSFAIT
jgi:hypothetical protein